MTPSIGKAFGMYLWREDIPSPFFTILKRLKLNNVNNVPEKKLATGSVKIIRKYFAMKPSIMGGFHPNILDIFPK